MLARSRWLLALTVLLVPALAGAAKATLAWDPVTTRMDGSPVDLAGYKIYYSTEPGPPFTGTFALEGPSPITAPLSAFSDPQGPQFTITVPSCSQVYLAVTAYDSVGEESGYSNVLLETIAPKPEVKAGPGEEPGTLLVSWLGLASYDQGKLESYRVYHRSPTGPEAEPLSVGPGQTSVLLSGLKAGEVVVAVEAVCADGKSKRSDELTAALSIDEAEGGLLVGGCSLGGPGTDRAGRPGLSLLLLGLLVWRRARR